MMQTEGWLGRRNMVLATGRGTGGGPDCRLDCQAFPETTVRSRPARKGCLLIYPRRESSGFKSVFNRSPHSDASADMEY